MNYFASFEPIHYMIDTHNLSNVMASFPFLRKTVPFSQFLYLALISKQSQFKYEPSLRYTYI